MPDLGQWVLLAVIVAATALAVGRPLLRSSPLPPAMPDLEGPELRHRVALEALHDVEADRRAGSLDEVGYQHQRDEAEARAALTLAELEAAQVVVPATPAARGVGRRPLGWLTAGLLVALLVGFGLPAPLGLGERTEINQPLADAQAQEAARQTEIQRLLTLLSADQRDTAVLSDLADAYLAGATADDLARAAVALQVLISLDPLNRSAYRRLVTAYISAGDWADASAATDSYAQIAAGEPDIPFFRGLIALRGSTDKAEAVRQFDQFLEMAPNDDRVSMVESLRADAAGELTGASPPPGT